MAVRRNVAPECYSFFRQRPARWVATVLTQNSLSPCHPRSRPAVGSVSIYGRLVNALICL